MAVPTTLFREATKAVKFTVYGRPQPQGSARAFNVKGGRFPVVTSDNKKLRSFRQEVTLVALKEVRESGTEMIAKKTPVSARLKFYFERPASRSRKAGMVTRPDIDKLIRAIFDGVTGVVVADDSQVVEVMATKEYGVPERTEVEIQDVLGVEE